MSKTSPNRLTVLFFCLATLVGCTRPFGSDADPLVAPLVEPGSPEERGLLAFVNDEGATFELLDDDVGLDRRAAQNIVDRRDGEDATFGTADDAPFTSVDELDAVSYVGSVALSRLLDWARDEGFIDASGDSRDRAILGLVNAEAADFALLDDDVGLDRRAAQNIVDRRDGADAIFGTADDRLFVSVAEVDAVSYVGASALQRLADYGLANGYDSAGPEATPPCVLISEYIEGPGANNKAVEIYNCGDSELSLASVRICLVRNDDTTCSVSSGVGDAHLPAGGVWTLCRTRGGTLSDPYAPLVDACDHEIGSSAIFNGDDRLMLFEDADRNQALGEGDTVLDTFGDPETRPEGTPWAERGLRRCDLTPRPSGAFEHADYFTEHGSTTFTHLGVPPSNTCGEGQAAAAGEDCLGHEFCAEGLRCYGRPFDDSTPYGKCVDTTPIAGEGANCDRYTQCAEGLICAGWTLWGEGSCNPQWMAGRYSRDVDLSVHDGPGGTISPWVVAYGLASVPVDLEVTLHLDHPRPTDLRVTLIDPNGDEAVLWDQSEELGEYSRSFVTTGISRDDNVNGRWHLRIEDLVSGEAGTFHSWQLFVVSRWD